MASLVRRVQDLVVKDGEVQGKTKTNWVGWGKVGLRNLGGCLVSLERLVGGGLALVTHGELGEVTVVVTLPVRCGQQFPIHPLLWQQLLHLVVENLGFTALGRRNQVLVENLENVFTDLSELGLDLLAVLLDEANLTLISLGLLLLLDGSDNSPRGTAGTNDVLVGDRKKVALFDGQLLVGRSHGFHVLNHL